MEVAIFIVYLLVFCFVITNIPFFKRSGISKVELLFLFLLKIAAGFAYAQFYLLPKYHAGSDTWRFYKLSIEEKRWLFSDPVAFTKDLFVHGYNTPGSLFSGENSYWNDLKSNVLVKVMALMNVFTNNSYYTNIIIFNFLFLFGLVALVRAFLKYYSEKKYLIIAGIFLLPSTLFWCSGIHKDGLILSALGLIIYWFDKSLKRGFNGLGISLMLLSSALIFSLRNYVLFALLPALLSWFFTRKYNLRKPWLIYTATYTVGIVLFFTIPQFVQSVNPPAILAQKQGEFLKLEGGSSITSEPLIPTLNGFLTYSPTAIDIAFLRPHFTEISNLSYVPAIAEILLFVALLAYTLLKFNKLQHRSEFICFLIFFSVSILLICGFTIPITGAVVRYRSIVLPLLITPMLCSISFPNWRK